MIYTASQIAAALGKNRRTMQRALNGVAASGQIVCGGNLTDAWAFADLPEPMRLEIATRSRRANMSAEEFLRNVGKPWFSPVSLAEIAPHCLDRAAKLQRALSRVLALQDDMRHTSGELEQMGLADFLAVFGYAIKARQLRKLIKRTHDRAGASGNYSRLEIYLDETIARKAAPKPLLPAKVRDEFNELGLGIQTFKNPAEPTAGERENFWVRVFEVYDERMAAGHDPKQTRLALREYLASQAGFLAKSKQALRVAFKRKYDQWCQHDRQAAALRDGRREKSGNHRAPEISADDKDRIIAHAVMNCGGRVSQAWRELIERRQLSEELLSYYLTNPASKSYVPAGIRNLVGAEVALMDDIHHGPRTAKLNGAHLLRDWSTVAPMDWLCADDCTLEVYFYIPDGKGWFTLTRGQLLLMIDCRTTRILGYALIPEKSYNSRSIRTLITKVADEHGLPRHGYYFERGIWQNSRLLKGHSDPFSWGEIEGGLRALGLKIKHSNLPRSKPVERTLGAIQDLMDGELGFVGGNEMKEKFERVQKQKLLVAKPNENGEHPQKYFFSFDEWIERLHDICDRYNAARQDGKLLAGLSPDEAFEKFARRDDPLIKLPPELRYKLSHDPRKINVTANGITLRFGKQVYNYRNAQTGRLIGQRVISWFNPETPEILAVTDLDERNPFTVERTQEVPAMDAPAELLAQEQARVNAHNAYAVTRYRILNAKFSTPFRRTIADAGTVDLGVQIANQRNAIQTRQQTESKQVARSQRAARNLGMAVPPAVARRPETAHALEGLKKLLNED